MNRSFFFFAVLGFVLTLGTLAELTYQGPWFLHWLDLRWWWGWIANGWVWLDSVIDLRISFKEPQLDEW